MANKRMFNKKIVGSGAFLALPHSAQSLYYQLNMEADDDGFVYNAKKYCILANCSKNDLKLLIKKNYLLSFENDVVVIKHWRLHNTIKKDRYLPTIYQKEYSKLLLNSDLTYTFNDGNILEPKGNQNGTSGLDLGLDIDLGLDKEKEKKDGILLVFKIIINKYTPDEELRNALKRYIQYRFSKNAGFNVNDLESFLDDLTDLSTDAKEQIAIIEQAIFNGYKDLSHLKRNGNECIDDYLRRRKARINKLEGEEDEF